MQDEDTMCSNVHQYVRGPPVNLLRRLTVVPARCVRSVVILVGAVVLATSCGAPKSRTFTAPSGDPCVALARDVATSPPDPALSTLPSGLEPVRVSCGAENALVVLGVRCHDTECWVLTEHEHRAGGDAALICVAPPAAVGSEKTIHHSEGQTVDRATGSRAPAPDPTGGC